MRSSTTRRRSKRGRVRTTLDNAVLDLRTVRRLGMLLWRPVFSELWSARGRAWRAGRG